MTERIKRPTTSKGLLILDALIKLIEDNKITDEYLKTLNVNTVYRHAPDDVRPPVVYAALTGLPVSQPLTLGKTRNTYRKIYIVHVVYIHSRIDREVQDELILAMDALTEFFEEHSALYDIDANGNRVALSNLGIEIHNAMITNYMDTKFIYHAVAMDVVVQTTKVKDRNL
jgi:hypothetical protein